MLATVWAVLAVLLLVPAPASAQLIREDLPDEVRDMEVAERLGESVPRDLVFVTHDGRQVSMGDYFLEPGLPSGGPAAAQARLARGLPPLGKPSILVLGYYRCPVVCSAVLDKLVESLDGVDHSVGVDFNVLVFSFDHTEGPADAGEKKILTLAAYDREQTPVVEAGWAFHTGGPAENRALANAVGYPYRLLDNGEYSHPVALIFLSPEGKLTRYIYGFDYPSQQVRLALLDASEGRMARSLGERFMHFCYVYDPNAGAYTLAAVRVMQIGGVLSIGFVTVLVGGLLAADRVRRSRRRVAAGGSGPAPGADGVGG
jgi:protein SCO1/2